MIDYKTYKLKHAPSDRMLEALQGGCMIELNARKKGAVTQIVFVKSDFGQNFSVSLNIGSMFAPESIGVADIETTEIFLYSSDVWDEFDIKVVSVRKGDIDVAEKFDKMESLRGFMKSVPARRTVARKTTRRTVARKPAVRKTAVRRVRRA